MPEEIKDNRFVFTVLKSLEPMGEIDCQMVENKILGLYKNDVMFGFILGAELYLRTHINELNNEIYLDSFDFKEKKYNKLRKNFLGHHDSLLQIATESYWLASGRR